MKNPMQIELCVSTVLGFVPDHKFLDLGTVSKLFRANYFAPKTTAVSTDTSYNNMVEYFENGMPTSERLPFRAAERGSLDVFELAVEHGCGINHRAIEVAARRGHVRILNYIWYKNCLCVQCACGGASRGGKLSVLKWLFPANKWFDNELAMSTMLVRNAVVKGSLQIVKWAHEKGQNLESALLSTAATYGHFELLKYIHFARARSESSGGKYPISAMLHAALHGDLRTLTWLREVGYPWSDGICVVLAGRGDLEALQYVRDNGCQWGLLTMGSVAPDIGKEMRQYLVDSGCPA